MSNITISKQLYLDKKKDLGIDLRPVVDIDAIYQAVYIAEKMYPERRKDIKNAFALIRRNNSIAVKGMGIEKLVSGIEMPSKRTDYVIYGKCLNIVKKFSSETEDVNFIFPRDQRIENSILIDDATAVAEGMSGLFNINRNNLTLGREEHVLIKQAKKRFEGIIDEQNIDGLVDTKDLTYQCLFRLARYNPSVYVEGAIVTKHIAGLPYHEIDTSKNWKFKDTVFKDIFNEQLRVVQREFYSKNRQLFEKLENLLPERGFLKKKGNQPYIILGGKEIPLEIKEVDKDLAHKIHGSFHYIHTPRNKGYVLGLFLKGGDMPISVIAVEKVDREYKKQVLRAHNISPQHTYELTRMYSCKNAPFNTSSFMLALTNSYLKMVDNKWEASISSFMPSYAGGLSMISGGFTASIFMKSCRHGYEHSADGDVVVRTNRSKKGRTVTANETMLMPVVELICAKKHIQKKLQQKTDVHVLKEDFRQ